ncbi:unnamed protein product [Symbiodinium natans]|uniref:Uncharacterized protein n=1 Tax=Symbiodinium natans TaxID=878477 RepID=A0A812SVL3_9DINO|nr:unnamed protein product [Symbiodinium natans]
MEALKQLATASSLAAKTLRLMPALRQALARQDCAKVQQELTSKEDFVQKHAVSIWAQMKKLPLSGEDSLEIIKAVQASSLGVKQKDEILGAVSERLSDSSTPKPKRSQQTMKDVCSFLTASEVTVLKNGDYNLSARVQALAHTPPLPPTLSDRTAYSKPF